MDFDLILESLENDVAQIGDTLKMVAKRVIDEEISKYPVFVASRHLVNIGKPMFNQEEVTLNWFFSASILEEFVQKQVVEKDNLKSFQRKIGDPLEKACILILTEEIAKVVFVPYDIQ